jgi:hypothetical protein
LLGLSISDHQYTDSHADTNQYTDPDSDPDDHGNTATNEYINHYPDTFLLGCKLWIDIILEQRTLESTDQQFVLPRSASHRDYNQLGTAEHSIKPVWVE